MKIKFLLQRIVSGIWFGCFAFLAYFLWSGLFFGFTLNQIDTFKLVFGLSALLIGFLYGYQAIINVQTKQSLSSLIKFGVVCALLILIFYVVFIVCIDMFKTCNIHLATPPITCYPEFKGFFNEIFIFGFITFLFGGWLMLIFWPLMMIFLRLFYYKIWLR